MSLPSTSRSNSAKYRRIASPADIRRNISSVDRSFPSYGIACSEPRIRSNPALATTARALAAHKWASPISAPVRIRRSG
jgi:hypothetical protein